MDSFNATEAHCSRASRHQFDMQGQGHSNYHSQGHLQSADYKSVNLADLRHVQGLRDKAKNDIDRNFGHRSRSVSSVMSECSVGTRDSDRGRHSAKMKPGITSKASEEVLNPQVWPQTFWDYEFIANPIEFKDLDFGLFVARELEAVMSCDISEKQNHSRLELLKTIVYYQRVYDWKSILKMYSAIVRKIESGRANWSYDFYRIESHTLVHKTKSSYTKGDGQNKKVENKKGWFCKDYQTGVCELSDPHKKWIGGKEYIVHHVCAACLQKDKVKLMHPETLAACPHNTQKE